VTDDAGCVRPTSASHHSVDENPRLACFRRCDRFYPVHPERGILHGTPLASAGRAPCFDAGCFFPAPRRSTEPLTPPSPSELPRDASPYFFGAAPTLSKDLDRLLHDPRDGTAASSIRGAFHRRVPSPPPARRHKCRRRAVTRAFADLAVLHSRDPALVAPSLTTTLLLALAIGERPPLARPRPRELVVRLEEDRAHASLGQATPDDFCNTTRRTGTPFEQSILARELREACASFFASALAEAPNPRCHRAFSAFAGGPAYAFAHA